MPRTIKEKMVMMNDIETFLAKRGSVGSSLPEVTEHLQANGWNGLATHVVYHQLINLRELKRATNWGGKGRTNTWVSTLPVPSNGNGAAPPSQVIVEEIKPSVDALALDITITKTPPAVAFTLNGVRVTINIP